MDNAIVGLLSALLVALVTQAGSFIRERRSSKDSKEDVIISEIKDLRDQVNTIEKHFDDYQAKAARNRVLRFESEIRAKQKHTYEMWTQVMDDIEEYQAYCDSHPDFKNGRGKKAIAHISKVYSTLEDSDEFEEV